MTTLTDMQLAELKEFALKKKELLESIYDITTRHKFSGDESEIEAFVEYLDIREPYYQQLAELEKNAGAMLKDFSPDFGHENGLYRDVSQIISNTKDITAQIVLLDKQNNENMGRLYEKLASDIRKISASKKARNSYNFFRAQSGSENGK